MHYNDVLVFLNKNAGVHFGLVKSIHDAHFLTLVLHRTWRAWVGCFLGFWIFHHLVRHRLSGTRDSSHLLGSDHYPTKAWGPQTINDFLAVYTRSVIYPGSGDLCRKYLTQYSTSCTNSNL